MVTVAGAACLMIAGNFIMFGTTILLPEIAAALGTDLSQVMLFPSLQAISGVVAMSVLAPRLYRRFGVRSTILAGGIWLAASLILAATATSRPVLYVAGFASGLTFGVVTMMAASLLVNTWFEERRGTMMGAVFAIAGLGGIAAGLVMPAIVSTWGHPGGFFALAAVVAGLVVTPAILIIRSTPQDVGLTAFGAPPAADAHPTPGAGAAVATLLPGVPAKRAFRSAQFIVLVLAIVAFGVANSMQQHFPPLFVERGVTMAAAGTLLSLMALTSVVTNIAIGTFNDRKGTLPAILLGLGGQLAALLTFAAVTGFGPLAAGIAVFALGLGFASVLLPITVMQLFGPRDYAAILGPAMAALPAGMAIGAPLWGGVAESTGSYTLPLLLAAGTTAASIVLLVWAIRTAPGLRKRVEQESGAQEPDPSA